jgi:hypothetical protein
MNLDQNNPTKQVVNATEARAALLELVRKNGAYCTEDELVLTPEQIPVRFFRHQRVSDSFTCPHLARSKSGLGACPSANVLTKRTRVPARSRFVSSPRSSSPVRRIASLHFDRHLGLIGAFLAYHSNEELHTVWRITRPHYDRLQFHSIVMVNSTSAPSSGQASTDDAGARNIANRFRLKALALHLDELTCGHEIETPA